MPDFYRLLKGDNPATLVDQLSEAQIRELAELLLPLCRGVPRLELTPREINKLNGRLFYTAPRFVKAVARGLGDGDLFPDVPFAGGHLMDRQGRATAWARLSHRLNMVARRAGHCRLLAQALAIDDAMLVLRQVEADRLRAVPPPDAAAREDAILDAEEALPEYR